MVCNLQLCAEKIVMCDFRVELKVLIGTLLIKLLNKNNVINNMSVVCFLRLVLELE